MIALSNAGSPSRHLPARDGRFWQRAGMKRFHALSATVGLLLLLAGCSSS